MAYCKIHLSRAVLLDWFVVTQSIYTLVLRRWMVMYTFVFVKESKKGLEKFNLNLFPFRQRRKNRGWVENKHQTNSILLNFFFQIPIVVDQHLCIWLVFGCKFSYQPGRLLFCFWNTFGSVLIQSILNIVFFVQLHSRWI